MAGSKNSGQHFTAIQELIRNLLGSSSEEQKQALGEYIYAQIGKMFPGLRETGKVTGMMLEIDYTDLLTILLDTVIFRSKVEEALQALRDANYIA